MPRILKAFLFCVFAIAYSITFANDTVAGDSVNVLKDLRDNQEYRTVKIGNDTWMAENLNFAIEESWCYTRFNYDCKKYGRFYTWNIAKSVCPAGWHLPTQEEFENLLQIVGADSAGIKLKSKDGWSHYGNGSDAYGFNATPSGFRDYRGRFDRQTMYAYLWSATEKESKALGMHLMAGRMDASIYPYGKDFALSVRCVKNQ